MPDLSIVIVNYNTPQYTAQCLDSLRQNPPRAPYEVVVVDNASNDDSVARLGAAYPEIKLVRSDKNRGIAGGNNLGIRAGSGKYVLLLNNDTLVLPGALNQLVEFLDAHPEAAAAGGRLVNPDGSFQSCFNDFPNLRSEFLSATRLFLLVNPYHPSYPDCREVRSVDWISSACLMLRRPVLEAVGCVDEEFFIYGDEPDLQYRIQQTGGKVFYLPTVATVHFGGRSLDRWKRRDLVYRGKLLFFEKHYGRLRSGMLALMLGGLSMAKMLAWLPGGLLPERRSRVLEELTSNWRVLRMCAQSVARLPGG